ncbi:MAG: glycosyltransferase [Pseudomonadota bacterium]
MSRPAPLVFFTICSKNFLAYARTLHASVMAQHPDATFFVALCDRIDGMIDPADEPFEIVVPEQLAIPDFAGMAERYNITELNTAIKPFVFEYLFGVRGASRVVYLDPDILVVSPLVDVVERLGVDVDAVLTPHVLDPAENAEIDDIKMLQLGTYNLGFVALHGTPEVRGIVRWWARRLERQCVIDVPNGLFVDQKWADLLPSFIPRTLILHHPGYNVAYWNLPQRRVVRGDAAWTVNGRPLVFFHFSGNDLYNEQVFARHSPSLTMEAAGDAAELLREYRARVFANGHARYATLPYAFNWSGASGHNEHTPEEVAARTRAAAASAAPAVSAEVQPSSIAFPVPVRPSTRRRIANAITTLRRARRHAGSLPSMLSKAVSVYRRGGLRLVRDTVRQLNLMYPVTNRGEVSTPVAIADYANSRPALDASQVRDERPRLLFIDWSTPRPDCDAGSITAFYLMKILVDLGYDVVFAPDDMLRLGHYTATLESIGVTCLSADRHGPLETHLATEGEGYDYALICRAPFAAKWLEPIRRHAPSARVILNTADLYFLREIREAELEGSSEKLEAAMRWKAQELDIIRRCDHCIVMSDHEQAILAREAPDARVHLVPLMFVDIPGRAVGFDARKDLLFIGGFLHRPNVDAVTWFCERVWPRVRERLPGVRVHLLGSNPDDEVRALGKHPGVEVVGFVEDIKPWFDAIRLSVAPLRYGAGIKGKLGTSLSFGVPSVATNIAVEGMHLIDGQHVLVADEEAAFAEAIVRLYCDPALWLQISDAGLRFVSETYSLDAGLRRVGAFMAEVRAASATGGIP